MGSYFAPHTKLTPSFTLAGCWLISIEQIDQHQRNGKSRFSSHQNGEKRETERETKESERGGGKLVEVPPSAINWSASRVDCLLNPRLI